MRVCQTCGKEKPAKAFAGKSEHCRDCDIELVEAAMDLIKGHYTFTYPAHIQAYLDKRKQH
jgi:hypothetical protein